MATPGYAALYRVPGAQQSGSRDKPVDNLVGEEKAPTMGLYSPGTPMEVQSPGQPQRLFDPSRARYAAGGLTGVFEEKEVSDDPGYRAYEEGGIVIPELQSAQDAGMPVDMLAQDEEPGQQDMVMPDNMMMMNEEMDMPEVDVDVEDEVKADVDVDVEDDVAVDAQGDDINIKKKSVKSDIEVGLSPMEELVQDSLEAAMKASEALGNDTLTDQIGNTITYFTREFVVGNRTD